MNEKWIMAAGSVLCATSLWLSAPVGTTYAQPKVLTSANVLGIPLRPGKVQLSCPFLKVDATITQADKDRVVFTSNYKNVAITPDTQRPGGISLAFGDDKLKGSIEKGPNRSVLSLDNIGQFTIAMADSKSYVISSKLPFNINVRFVD